MARGRKPEPEEEPKERLAIYLYARQVERLKIAAVKQRTEGLMGKVWVNISPRAGSARCGPTENWQISVESTALDSR